jgi:hypothetical protein
VAEVGIDVRLAWVGPDFGRGSLGRHRLLLVAPRQPLERSAIPRVGRTFDADLTPQYIDGSMKHQTFTDVARLILGGPVPRNECEDFWRSVAFSNLKDPTGGSRLAPELTDADAEEAKSFVEARLKELKPKTLILFDLTYAQALEERNLARDLSWSGVRLALPHPGAPGFNFREHTAATRKALKLGETS